MSKKQVQLSFHGVLTAETMAIHGLAQESKNADLENERCPDSYREERRKGRQIGVTIVGTLKNTAIHKHGREFNATGNKRSESNHPC